MKGRRAGVLIVAGLLLAACGSDDDSTPTTAAPGTTGTPTTTGGQPGTTAGEQPTTTLAQAEEKCTEDRVGGEITMAVTGNARSLDMFDAVATGSVTSGYDTEPIYSQLIRYDTDRGEFVPQVAESLTPNDDFTVWTLTLRDGVEFGNGDPLDADALIAHLDRHLEAGSKSGLARYAAQISGYEKTGPLEVTFTLPAPWTGFPELLALRGLGEVQNVAVVDQMGQAEFAKKPTGGGVGPYEVESWNPPESIVYRAKDDWWGGPVCIEKLTITLIPSLDAAYESFLNGDIDMITLNNDPPLQRKAQEENPGDFRVLTLNAAGFLMPNVGVGSYTGPFTDVRVRMAAAYAIDPDVVNERGFGGDGFTGKGLINDVAVSLTPTDGLPYDPDKAKELLDEYKAETGWDGSIRMDCATAIGQDAVIAMAALLDAVGFKVTLNSGLTPSQVGQAVIVDKSFELVCWGFSGAEAALFSSMSVFNSANPGNYNGYKDPGYDAALNAMKVADGAEAYQAAVDEMQDVINETVPFVVYTAAQPMFLHGPDVKGLQWNIGVNPVWDTAYIDS